jgi:malonyl-CoA/methylmalonyl-CoA synthetase
MLLTPLFVGALVEFLPKFSTSEVWQCLRDSSSNLEMKTQKPITVFSGVPTMYVRLLQGFNTMDTEAQKACSFAARNLRLMVSLSDVWVIGVAPTSDGEMGECHWPLSP